MSRYAFRVLLMNAVFVIFGSYRAQLGEAQDFQLKSLDKFALSFYRAEVYLDRVDDTMSVTVNGQPGDTNTFNHTRPWVDVTSKFREGENTLHVKITNEKGGACGGRLLLRFDGDDATIREWLWKRKWAPSEVPCVDEDITTWKYSSPPLGFHVAEVLITEVDDGLILSLAGQQVETNFFDNVRPWRDVSKLFKEGQNEFWVQILNGKGGHCGGRVSLRVDGKLQNTPWFWNIPWAPSEVPCVNEAAIFQYPRP